MRLLIFVLGFTLLTNIASGQEEKYSSKSVAGRFEYFYNQNLYDSIFIMFSTEMKNAMPLTKTVEFFTGLSMQSGKITHRVFTRYENGSYASYKTQFERSLFSLNISLDNNSKINGLFIKPFKPDLPVISRNQSKLILPFNGTWYVLWGGDTKELNYHVINDAQKNAFDFLIMDNQGKTYKSYGRTNDDYYAYGKDIIAPCDGIIVSVVDGVKDNQPGEMNAFDVGGNTIILKTLKNEFLVFCHIQHNSIKVKENQMVVVGQLLGLCGNTGNSTEPHLHFHIQNVEDINKATGAKCFFDKIIVNGKLCNDYSPLKNEMISNSDN